MIILQIKTKHYSYVAVFLFMCSVSERWVRGECSVSERWLFWFQLLIQIPNVHSTTANSVTEAINIYISTNMFSWYWWSCWTSLFKFSIHNLFNRIHWRTRSMFYNSQLHIQQDYKPIKITNKVMLQYISWIIHNSIIY